MNASVNYAPVDESLLAEVVHRILALGSPQSIVLFGSQARGDARFDSDLDLLIVEESSIPRWERSTRYYKALRGIHRAKDIIVWTPSEIAEWASVPSHFISTAMREGKVLYEQ